MKRPSRLRFLERERRRDPRLAARAGSDRKLAADRGQAVAHAVLERLTASAAMGLGGRDTAASALRDEAVIDEDVDREDGERPEGVGRD